MKQITEFRGFLSIFKKNMCYNDRILKKGRRNDKSRICRVSTKER